MHALSRAAMGLIIVGGIVLSSSGCTPKSNTERAGGADSTTPTSSAGTLALTSLAFAHQASMPKKYTCEGEGVSPPLAWTGVPAGTKSLVLIVDDPDAPDPAAPKMTWVHWVLYDMPPSTRGLPEAVEKLPPGTREGINGWKKKGWGAPCPPIGRHRYVHKLYALDKVLPDLGDPDEDAVVTAMKGHILGRTELVGTYQKSAK